MKRNYLFNLFFASVIFGSAVSSMGQESIASTSLNYCDLLKEPKEFDGKRVTIKATYRYGFEWQELFCFSCREIGKTWLEIDDNQLSASARKALKKFPKDEGTVTAIFSGRFESSNGPFGDGSFRFRFVLEDVNRAEIVSKSGFDPSHFPKDAQKKICGANAP